MRSSRVFAPRQRHDLPSFLALRRSTPWPRAARVLVRRSLVRVRRRQASILPSRTMPVRTNPEVLCSFPSVRGRQGEVRARDREVRGREREERASFLSGTNDDRFGSSLVRRGTSLVPLGSSLDPVDVVHQPDDLADEPDDLSLEPKGTSHVPFDPWLATSHRADAPHAPRLRTCRNERRPGGFVA